MSENLRVIRTFVDAMNRHDVDALQSCYHRAALVHYPGRDPQTPQDYAEGERRMLAAVPDYHIEAVSLMDADGGHVILELRMSGTQREDLGGKSFSITGAYIFRLEGGLIVEERAYPDALGLRRQLAP